MQNTRKNQFEKTVIDLGTGDGRFIYKNALKNPQTLYIGVDPNHTQLEEYKRKANRKRLANALFLVGSIEQLPTEVISLEKQAEEINVILPWGSLLKHIMEPQKDIVTAVANLLQPTGTLKIILGYSKETEPTETARLEIPEITEQTLRNTVIPKFETYGKLALKELTTLSRGDLRKIESTWSKRLSFGNDRPIFKLRFLKEAPGRAN
jgi:16S rRNA (adenine(1408)-N(1))-methyltransferase